MNIKLTGVNALIVIVAIVAIGGYQVVLGRGALDSEVTEKIKMELMPEYLGPHIENARRALEAGDMDEVTASTDEILGKRLEFKSLSARGSGDNVIVRAEVLINGRPPEDGKAVRYFKFRYSHIAGWRLLYETWWPSYYLKLW